MSIKSMVGKKCGRCGLRLQTHTDAKCSMILSIERDALLLALKGAAYLLDRGSSNVKETLRWIETHGSHEDLKDKRFYR